MSHQEFLGEWVIQYDDFPNLEAVFAEFNTSEFQSFSTPKRFDRINQILLELIVKAPSETFLLPALIKFISKINQTKIFAEHYRFFHFEFWLNQYSNLTEQQNYEIRAKIAGKYLPRNEYQTFFPIGMNKVYPGTHFVISHLSPDPDTMVAAFWGWVDAFAAKVGTGQHIWCLPGGPPDSPLTLIYRELFGEEIFLIAARTSGAITLSAIDLLSQKNFIREGTEVSVNTLDHGYNDKAMILVDEQGHYLGDWRSQDVEHVRQILILFKSCLRWLENCLQMKLISLFAKKDLNVKDIPFFLKNVFQVCIKDCEPIRGFSKRQTELLNLYLVKILQIPEGINATFFDINQALQKVSNHNFFSFLAEVDALPLSDLFTRNGNLEEDRSKIFQSLEKMLKHLHSAIYHIHQDIERLGCVMQIKKEVLGSSLHFLTLRNDIEEIRLKMKHYNYLTVVISEDDNKFPLGIVWANDLRKPTLGTVSLRDFCNQEEAKIASYLSIISVIDHHKSTLQTDSPPLAIIGDVQSCNVLIAEKAFLINDNYSTAHRSLEDIEQELQSYAQEKPTATTLRLRKRLIQRQLILQGSSRYYISPEREATEYLTFLHAILDDTDLLTKVSHRDVECVVQLLNRLKSLQLRQEVEIVNLDGISQDQFFAKNAAKRILKHPEMYSLYKKSFALKEREVENNLKSAVLEGSLAIFMDTKEQNGCCRVGQIKMFSSNFPTFFQYAHSLRELWVKTAEKIYRDRPEFDLHLLMISTISSAEEVYQDSLKTLTHRDEIWFWVPSNQQACDHLAIFLSSFQTAPEVINNQMHLEMLHSKKEEMQLIFEENFLPIPIKSVEANESHFPTAILHFNAGSINSRKSMISPYLPRLVT